MSEYAATKLQYWGEKFFCPWAKNLEEQLAAAQAQRDEKDKQLADCYDRMNKAEAQRDKALVALNSIKEYWNQDRNEKDMFYACWFAINTAEEVLKECGK